MSLRGRVKKKNLCKVNKTACRNLSYSVRKVLPFFSHMQMALRLEGVKQC